jgi:hypothetical protein
MFILKRKISIFASKIIPPQYYTFPSNTFNVDTEGNVTSFCKKTIDDDIKPNTTVYNISQNMGKLNGRNIKTDWIEWEWKIPEYAPKIEYKVIIDMWNHSHKDNNGKVIPILSNEWSFYVTDSNDSHYQPRVSN